MGARALFDLVDMELCELGEIATILFYYLDVLQLFDMGAAQFV